MPAFADAAKKHAFPDKTYTDKLTVLGGNEAIDLYYFGPAHTNGDTFVVFRALRVMHAGDVFAAKGTPFIDRNNGGSGVAYPETLAKAAAGIKDVETVIPGHSAVTTWAAFVEFGEFMNAFLAAAQAAKKAGKTADQARRRAEAAGEVQGLRDAARQGQLHGDLRRPALATRGESPAAFDGRSIPGC